MAWEKHGPCCVVPAVRLDYSLPFSLCSSLYAGSIKDWLFMSRTPSPHWFVKSIIPQFWFLTAVMIEISICQRDVTALPTCHMFFLGFKLSDFPVHLK